MTDASHIRVVDTRGRWRKSSYSGGQGNCVQAIVTELDIVPVRDSKRPVGAVLQFGRTTWSHFIAHLG